MTHDTLPEPVPAPTWASARNALARAAGTSFAYRELGRPGGVPLILLNHWGAVLDDVDPRIADGLARHHHLVAIDYRGIGASGGTAPVTVEAMARDTARPAAPARGDQGLGPPGAARPGPCAPAGPGRQRRRRCDGAHALSRDMARRIPHAQLIVYPDAGHGSLFQYHDDFVATVLAFLATPVPHSPTTHIGTQ